MYGLAQGDCLHADILVEEEARRLAELVAVLRGKITAGGVLGAHGVDVGMAREVSLEAGCHVLALRNDAHAARRVLQYFVEQQGIVRAAEYDGIYGRVAHHEGVDALLYEVVGAGRVVLVVLDERHPQRAGHPRHLYVGPQLGYLHAVAAALDGALGGQHAHVARQRQPAYAFGRGADYAKHAARGVDARQVVLLDGAQGLGRRRVAGYDDQAAAHREQPPDGFEREAVDHVERARPVRSAGVVAKVDVVILRQEAAHLVEDGQSAVA